MTIDVARLKILIYPAAPLRVMAEPVSTIDGTVRAVAARMIELTRQARGVGLAAPQVGLAWRMFTTAGDESEPDRVFINPRLLNLTGDLVSREEGCLSLPGINVDIRRPDSTTITAQDLDGASFTLTADDLTARVWQHEYDHLDGILIIDKMTPIDRLATRKALKELEATSP